MTGNDDITRLAREVFYLLSIGLFTSLFSCGKVAGADVGEHQRLAFLLASRFEQVQSLKWEFRHSKLKGGEIDWANASIERDPFEQAKKAGIDAFEIVEDGAANGSATFVHDHIFSIGFVQNGNAYQVLFDGELFAQRTPTIADGGVGQGPDLVEISETGQEGDVRRLGFWVSGYHFAPMRIPQVRSCFGTTAASVSLAEFARLIQSERTTPELKVVDGRFFASFPALVDGKEAGHVTYTFSGDGYLESAAWNAGEFWSASDTIGWSDPIELESIRLPTVVTSVNWTNTTADRYRFEKWGFVAQSELKLEIPDGALVTDHVNQLAYTNSGGVSSEARAAERYAIQHDLRLPSESTQSDGSRLLLLACALLLPLVFLGVLFFWRRSAKAVSASKASLWLTFAFFVLMSREGLAQHASSNVDDGFVRWVPDSGWVLKRGIPGISHLSQCGSTCAMLALELSGRQYNPSFVASQLKPSDSGISMLAIKDCLIAHGISVDARSDLAFDEIEKLAKQYEFLIVHIPQYQQYGVLAPHYVIVYRSTNGATVILDPPFDPVETSNVDSAVSFKMKQMTALLCRRVSPQSRNWRPTPELFELTKASFKDGSWRGTILLRNAGANPIALVGAQATCDCVEVSFNPTAVSAGKAIQCELKIDESRWANHPQKVRFVDAYGREQYVSILGSVSGAENDLPPDNVSPLIHYQFDVVVPFELRNDPLRHQFRIGVARGVPDGRVVAGPLRCGTLDLGVDRARTVISGAIKLEPECLRKLSNGLPYMLTSTFSVDGSKFAQVNFRARRSIECTADYEFVRSSICRLRLGIDNGFDWSVVSCKIPGLKLLDITQSEDGQFILDLERQSHQESTFAGEVRFSHPEFLPFEKIIAIRWEDLRTVGK